MAPSSARPGASHAHLEQAEPLVFPETRKNILSSTWREIVQGSLSQLYSELIVHVFYPAVERCEDCVYTPVDIGNLIQDFRESSNFLKLVKRSSPGFFIHIFVEEEESK